MLKLILRRNTGFADKYRSYRFFLDGIEICELKSGAEFTYEIEEGQHIAEAKIDWCGSRPFTFDAHSNDVYINVKSALRGVKLFLGLFYISFKPRDYIELELETNNAGKQTA